MSWSPEFQRFQGTQVLSSSVSQVLSSSAFRRKDCSEARNFSQLSQAGGSDPHLCRGMLAMRIQASECRNIPECSATHCFVAAHPMSPEPALRLCWARLPLPLHRSRPSLTTKGQSSKQWVYFSSSSFKPEPPAPTVPAFVSPAAIPPETFETQCLSLATEITNG